MIASTFLPFLALAATSSAVTLHVASYTGTITSFNFTSKGDNKAYQLTKLAEDTHCSPNATWLDLDTKNNNLFCLDENIAGVNGSLNSYKIEPATGGLLPIARLATLGAPANSVGYTSPNGTQMLAVAQYAHGLTTWRVDPATAEFSRLEGYNFTLLRPGPNPDGRQATAHPHQVTIDPTNKFLVIPDLGADLLRVFSIDPSTTRLSEKVSFPVEPGSGPRHGAWLKKGNDTYFYLVTELKSQLLPFKVDYAPEGRGLRFTLIQAGLQTYGPAFNATTANSTYPGEVLVGKDKKHLYVSNRKDGLSTYKAANGRDLPSDSISHWTIGENGVPKYVEISAAGGSYVRSFALSPDGRFAAVPLQRSGSLKVFAVSGETGKLGIDALASFEGLGNVTSVVWGGS